MSSAAIVISTLSSERKWTDVLENEVIKPESTGGIKHSWTEWVNLSDDYMEKEEVTSDGK